MTYEREQRKQVSYASVFMYNKNLQHICCQATLFSLVCSSFNQIVMNFSRQRRYLMMKDLFNICLNC